MRGVLPTLLLLSLAVPAFPQSPCEAPEARQLDFWVGEWDLTWQGGTGTNRIERALDGCGIVENFEGAMANGNVLKGMSVSVYHPKTKAWRQTWIDNRGGYLDFTGGLDENGTMILSHEREENGKTIRTRMRWTDVTGDSFAWVYEMQDAEGAWVTNWTIQYARKK